MNSALVKCPLWLAELIKAKGGTVPFANFMDWALNEPKNGSYGSGKLKIGIRGDFVTSPSLGDEFCNLLAIQFAQWIHEFDLDNKLKVPISIIDIGPGEGHLAFNLISALVKDYPSLVTKINFLMVEINEGMRKRQKPSNNTGDDRLSKSLRAWNC